MDDETDLDKMLAELDAKPESPKFRSDKSVNLSIVGKIAQNRPEVNALRSASLKRAFANPEVRKRQSKSLKAVFCTPEQKIRRSKAGKKAWADPYFRESQTLALKRGLSGAAIRSTLSTQAKDRWKDPDYRARMTQRAKEIRSRPEVLEAHRIGTMATAKAKFLADNPPEVIARYRAALAEGKGGSAGWGPVAKKYGLPPDRLGKFAKGSQIHFLDD